LKDLQLLHENEQAYRNWDWYDVDVSFGC